MTTMNPRIQLNLRLDKYPEIYELIKKRAKREGSSINDFAINLIRDGLGLETDKTPITEALDRITTLEKQVQDLENILKTGASYRPYITKGIQETTL